LAFENAVGVFREVDWPGPPGLISRFAPANRPDGPGQSPSLRWLDPISKTFKLQIGGFSPNMARCRSQPCRR